MLDNAQSTIRLLIADDQQMLRVGLSQLLLGSNVDVAFQAGNAAEAVRFTKACKPDVVLLDINLPDADGFTALEKIKAQCPRIPVVMFSVSDDVVSLAKARQLGATGFLSKAASRTEILETVRRAVAGRPAWSRSQVKSYSKKLSHMAKGCNTNSPLTPRELQIVRMLARGWTNDDIATDLDISAETVRHHLERLFAKIAVSDRTQAAIWALREGLLEDVPPNC